MGRAWSRWAWIAAASCAVAGCAVVTAPRLPLSSVRLDYRPLDAAAPIPPRTAYHEYAGVIHIHTRYSDGTDTYEDIARVANAEHLDYLIVTDHNTLQPLRDGRQGWWGSVLVLVGTEISTRDGHYLALNVTQDIDREDRTTQEIIDAVNRQGGFGFIAHPYYKRRHWTDWTVTGFTGLEIYNAAHEAMDASLQRLAFGTLFVPMRPLYWSLIHRPYDPLAAWDALIAERGRVVGIGSSDAHGYRLFGFLKVAPYHVLFQLVRTHLLIPAETLTKDGVYDALRAGHAFAAIELDDEARGFSFAARRNGRTVGIMGDEVPWTPDLQLVVSAPAEGRMLLFKDGQPAGMHLGRTWEVPVASPGVYRLEVSRRDKPWIVSNPIYVRQVPGP